MDLCIFSIFDSASETYAVPFFAPTKAVAIRDFARLARDPSSNIHAYPHDFSLHCLGVVDLTQGSIAPRFDSNPIARASDYEVEHEEV